MTSDRRSFYEQLLARAAAPPPPPSPRASASVVPWRRRPDGGVEVFWVRRSPRLRFMGGWYAFPGGGLGRGDDAVATGRPPSGATDATFHPPAPGLGPDARRSLGPDLPPGLVACAVRELFEETGLLPAPALYDAPSEALAELAADRRRLLDGELTFAQLLDRHRLELDAGELTFAGRWLTPPFAPRRFDNRFFLLPWPAERPLQPAVLPGELEAGEWIAPGAALARWQSGEILTAPPILHLLRVLDGDGPEAGLERLRDTREADLGPLRRVEFAPGVVMLPLRTPTLPPATHTNAYLLGRRRLVLVDPGTPLEDERQDLLGALAAAAESARLEAIWLTHHHRDHTGAVPAVRDAFGIPVLAHEAARRPLAAQGIAVDATLDDGQRVDLGDGFTVRVLHAPGHARGHLAFLVEAHGTVICGDLVSALSTIVIDPPEGDMGDYLASLARLEALAPRLLMPGHGPPIPRAVERLRWYRRHREEREQQVLAAWRAGQRDAAAMVPAIYPDVPPLVRPVAARQVEAHLEHLRRRGLLD